MMDETILLYRDGVIFSAPQGINTVDLGPIMMAMIYANESHSCPGLYAMA